MFGNYFLVVFFFILFVAFLLLFLGFFKRRVGVVNIARHSLVKLHWIKLPALKVGWVPWKLWLYLNGSNNRTERRRIFRFPNILFFCWQIDS